MNNEQQAKVTNLIDTALEMARQQGATAAEVDISIDTGFSATARMAEAETLEYHHDNELSLTVYVDQHAGVVSTSDLRHEALQQAVTAALEIAKYTETDPANGLPDKAELATKIPTLDINYPWQISAQTAMQLAQECDELGLQSDPRIINSDGATVNTHQGLHAYGNSLGFNHNYYRTEHTISQVLVAQDKTGMQRDYDYYTAVDAIDLPSINTIANNAANNTLRRLNPSSVKTANVPVLFSAQTAKSIIGHFIGAIKGSALYKKSSFLLDELGQTIFPEWFSLIEEPHLAKALGSKPFDAHGLATYSKAFIKQGVLKNYALGTYSARKLNMVSTANAGGSNNLIVTPGVYNLAEMLRELDTGFYVTEVMGQGVNRVTGDYSRGVAGFWVQNGEIEYAVDEATLAGNLRDMFKQIRCVGSDVDTRSRIRTPSLIIDGLMLAGAS